eukprot:symbB.v1.2.033442.t1/scaffold4157.1/size43777/1
MAMLLGKSSQQVSSPDARYHHRNPGASDQYQPGRAS